MVIFFKKLRKLPRDWGSSVAKVGNSPPPPPPIGLLTKVQKKKNTTYFSSLETVFFALEWTEKWFKASFEAYIQGGGWICLQLKSQINENSEKFPKTNNQIWSLVWKR